MPDPMIRVVVAKPGLDGHDRGAKVVARALRDAGMEVIYTGIFQSAEQVVSTVVQEDADVLGLSILSGAHIHYAEEILSLLSKEEADDILLLMGGIIPKKDIPRLKELGVAGVFGPGTYTTEIVRFIREWAAENRPS
ncbi:MAG: cobalamin B12-binding domain-containing protein [Dehalococcoidia bacterium]